MSDFLAFATPRRQSRAALLGTWLDGGGLKLYSGTRPADADTAITDQVLLAEFVLPNPAGSATDGLFTGDLPDPAMIQETETPTWGRFYDSLGVVVCDGDVGASGSGSAIEVENTSFVQGAYASITSITIEEG